MGSRLTFGLAVMRFTLGPVRWLDRERRRAQLDSGFTLSYFRDKDAATFTLERGGDVRSREAGPAFGGTAKDASPIRRATVRPALSPPLAGGGPPGPRSGTLVSRDQRADHHRLTTVEEAWQVVLAYARRYQIELAFRFGKSELAMESPRLWTWERRVKLLLMVTLAYAFLLSLLDEPLLWLREWLLRHFCPQTGKRSRQVAAPLYRLRSALSRLWQAHPQPPAPRLAQRSG